MMLAWIPSKVWRREQKIGPVLSLTWKTQYTPRKYRAAEIARDRASRLFCRNKE